MSKTNPFKGLRINGEPVSKEEFVSWYDEYAKRCSGKSKKAHKTPQDFMDQGNNVIEVLGSSVILNGVRVNVHSVTVESNGEITMSFRAIPYSDRKVEADDLSGIDLMY